MRLGDSQREFSFHIACLIQHIYASGYECTFGDAYRNPQSHGKMGDKGPYGRPYSAHKQRLAVDLNLFKDGIWLRSTKAHEPFGEYWVALHPENVWGGDFNDGNHYSRRHGGIA
jgi:hypothetical protein